MSLADHALSTRPEPAIQKIAQSTLNDTTQSVHIEEEGLRPTTNRMAGKNIFQTACDTSLASFDQD